MVHSSPGMTHVHLVTVCIDLTEYWVGNIQWVMQTLCIMSHGQKSTTCLTKPHGVGMVFKHLRFIPPATKSKGVYWNWPFAKRQSDMSVRPSVCRAHLGFRRHNCFPCTPIIMKLHMQTRHEARMCHLDFEVKGQKVKVTMNKVLWTWFPAHNCLGLYTYHHATSHADFIHEARMCPIDLHVTRKREGHNA